MLSFTGHKNIVGLYALLLISIIMNFVPSMSIQILGMVLFLVVFIALYLVRAGVEKGSFDYAHCTYMIKTIWIFSLFTIIGIILAYSLGDHSIIEQATRNIQSGIIPSEDELMNIFMQYSKDNAAVFLLTFLPIVFYLCYRLGYGVYLARKNDAPQNLKKWF